MRKLILILSPCLLWTIVVNAAPWTADVTGAEIITSGDPGRRLVRVMIKFTDGVTTVNDVPFDTVSPSTTSISNFCKGKVAQYEALDSFIAAPPLGPVDLTKILPTLEEIARNKYFADKTRLDFLESLRASDGLSAEGLQDLANQKVLVQSEYRREYIGIVP